MDLISLPFVGTIGVIDVLVTLITFVFGYIIGNSLKTSLKYILAIVVIIAAFVFFGFISADILGRLSEIIIQIKPLIPDLMGISSFFQTISLPLVGLVAGFVYGAVKK